MSKVQSWPVADRRHDSGIKPYQRKFIFGCRCPKGVRLEREREKGKKSFIIGPQLQFRIASLLLLPSSSQQNKNYKRKIAFSHRNCQQPSFCLLDLTSKKDMVNIFSFTTFNWCKRFNNPRTSRIIRKNHKNAHSIVILWRCVLVLWKHFWKVTFVVGIFGESRILWMISSQQKKSRDAS